MQVIVETSEQQPHFQGLCPRVWHQCSSGLVILFLPVFIPNLFLQTSPAKWHGDSGSISKDQGTETSLNRPQCPSVGLSGHWNVENLTGQRAVWHMKSLIESTRRQGQFSRTPGTSHLSHGPSFQNLLQAMGRGDAEEVERQGGTSMADRGIKEARKRRKLRD